MAGLSVGSGGASVGQICCLVWGLQAALCGFVLQYLDGITPILSALVH